MDGAAHDQSTRDRTVVIAIAVIAALAATTAGAAPTGTPAIDAIWCIALSVLVTLSGPRARTGALLWLAAIAAMASIGSSPLSVTLGVGSLLAVVLAIAVGRWLDVAAVRAAVSAAAVVALLGGSSYGPTGLPTVVAAAAVAPVLWAGFRALGQVGRRRTVLVSGAALTLLIVAAGLSGLVALQVRNQLEDATQQARDGLTLAREGNTEAAAAAFESAADGFEASRSRISGPMGTVGRAVPVVGPQVEAVRRVSAAGVELASAAGATMRDADPNQLRTDQGGIDLDALASMQGAAHASLTSLYDARSTIEDVRSPWLLPVLDDRLAQLDDELADSLPTAELTTQAIDIVPSLLGADGPRRYLLQFATPGESRGAGGYIGQWGVITAAGGQLDLESTGSTDPAVVAPTGAVATFDPPPGWEERYADHQVGTFFGNVSADPDWPTDSEVARQLYAGVPAVGEVDGTLYVDPSVLAAVLDLTGPITVPSLPGTPTLDADNVEQFLLLDQYEQFESDTPDGNEARRDALGDVTTAVFDALTTRDLPSIGDVLDTLGPVVAGGHLKFVAFEEQASDLLRTTGLSGAWDPEAGADYISVRVTDLLANKIELFLDREVEVRSVHDRQSGSVESTVSIDLTNTASPDLPFYVVGNFDGLPIGTNRSSIAVYSPLALVDATLDGDAIRMQVEPYGSGWIYSFPVQLAPDQARNLTLSLRGSVEAATYRLQMLPQPLASPDQVDVLVRSGDRRASFTGPLDRDLLLTPAVEG